MNRIDVKTGGMAQLIAVATLVLGVGGCSVFMIVGELARGRIGGALIGAVLLAIVGAAAALYLRARTRSALVYVSDTGIGLRGGTEVPWSQVRRLTDRRARNRRGQPVVWRSELEVDGHPTIWLIPQRIQNFREVHAFCRSKPIPYVES